MICNICPRACAAWRDDVRGDGVCGMGLLPVIARAAPHFDEEPIISGTRGSGTIFFSGCALRCAYCQNYDISVKRFGQRVSVDRLRQIYLELVARGVHNINLVSPTHFAPAVIESLDVSPGVPVIWNSSGYERADTLKSLAGKVNVYLPDFKYASGELAARYSNAADYVIHATNAINEMLRQTGGVRVGEDGLIISGTLIRHLILPGQAARSIEALRYIRAHFEGAWVSLMAQYVPMGDAARFPEINRRLTKAEYDMVVDEMFALGLEDGFVQERASAKSKYVPAFDLTGVKRAEG